jgi:tellurium resistance protein TerD
VTTILTKGGNVSLTKLASGTLSRVSAAAGWDVNQDSGPDFDLDLITAGVDKDGKVPTHDDPTDRGWQEWLICANHRHDAERTVIFTGDNRTGAGEGDDEITNVDLTRVPAYIDRIIFSVVIWRAQERGQQFGNVQNAFIRIFDTVTGEEFVRFNLGKEFADETLVIFGELYRRGNEWKFRAIGQGYDAAAFRAQHGIPYSFEYEYARYRF